MQEAVATGKGCVPQTHDEDQEPVPEIPQDCRDTLGLATVQAQRHAKQNAQSQPQEQGTAGGCWLEQGAAVGSRRGHCRRVAGQSRQLPSEAPQGAPSLCWWAGVGETYGT